MLVHCRKFKPACQARGDGESSGDAPTGLPGPPPTHSLVPQPGSGGGEALAGVRIDTGGPPVPVPGQGDGEGGGGDAPT